MFLLSLKGAVGRIKANVEEKWFLAGFAFMDELNSEIPDFVSKVIILILRLAPKVLLPRDRVLRERGTIDPHVSASLVWKKIAAKIHDVHHFVSSAGGFSGEIPLAYDPGMVAPCAKHLG